MKLFSRDFNIMTPEEIRISEEVKARNTSMLGNMEVYNSSMYREFPKAKRHFDSLFPNNFLDIADLQEIETLRDKNIRFKELIENKGTIESDILGHIKSNESYHIIGSIMKHYHFGHHEAYLFPEFQLGNSYKADYLILGKSSDGYQFIYVELENPYGRITRAGGEFGEVINKGIKQIEDWKTWLESNYSSITETFKKEAKEALVDEFYKYDSTRCHYVIVAGRRADYTDKTYLLKRRMKAERRIELLHYDNIIDSASNIVGAISY